MAKIGRLLGMPESPRSFEGTDLLPLRKCNTGIEFEAEEVKEHLPLGEDEAGYWEEKKDDSLRGNSMEYVLREPLFGADLISALKWFCDWASKQKLGTNFRTGFHVHIDVRNLETEELISMAVYYALYEKVLFQWVGDAREGSIFCMPFYKAEGVLESVARALGSGERIRDAAKSIDRYSAFNMNSLSRFGTVEWRHMQTTFNFERVLNWVKIAQSFKKYAKGNPLRPDELLAEVSKLGPKQIFENIVGPELGNLIWTPESEKQMHLYGFPVAQEIATLLHGTKGLAWTSVRKSIGEGDSPKWAKWVKKQQNSEDSKPLANPFMDIEALASEEYQRTALDALTAIVREKLDNLSLT